MRFGLLLIGFICCFSAAVAQIKAEGPNQDPAFSNANQFFASAIKDQARLYNGREYNFYFGFEGLAYFQARAFDEKGSIVFDGVKFDQVPLLLDLFKQKLVTMLPNHVAKLELSSEKISSFTLYDHHFINTQFTVANNKNVLISGFIDQLYIGKCKILVKREKKVHETSNMQGLKKFFVDKSSYFLEKQGKVYQFASEKSLLVLLADKKNEMKRYLKENNIKFKNDPERTMVMIVAYYDKLFS